MKLWSSRDVLFGLHELQGIGWKSIRAIEELIGWEELPGWVGRSVDDWLDLGFRPSAAAILSKGLTNEHIHMKMDQTYKAGINWITILDESYPPLLKETSEPPWVLYGIGDWSVLDHRAKQAVAMVGTRHATVYGKKVAFRLAADLAAMGITVVSGLARGIDAASHEGALSTGATIAVLGSAITSLYPPEHIDLAHRIAASGLLITEYPIGTMPRAGLFPRRNRIIAGLTLATVVVEAPLNSGAMLTADIALNMSRDVLAVPGPITSPKSDGTFKLLKEGSKPVATVQDIIEEISCQLTILPSADNNGTVTLYRSSAAEGELSEQEMLVMDRLEGQRATFDELLFSTALPFAQLHSILLSLQLKKRIHEHAGGVYGSIWT
ncbi:DNA-processing protein DprA [Paenibacillus marinisediminis]